MPDANLIIKVVAVFYLVASLNDKNVIKETGSALILYSKSSYLAWDNEQNGGCNLHKSGITNAAKQTMFQDDTVFFLNLNIVT